jgi:3-hydroxyacyl-CoA dehydrogenase
MATDSEVSLSRPCIVDVGVLGAGTMGSRIAAHLANAGCRVILLDRVTDGAAAGTEETRNAIANAGLQSLRKSRPPAIFDESLLRQIEIGNFVDDLPRLNRCDWIIEAVTENIVVKRELLGRVEQYRRDDAIVSTNTSGISVKAIAEEFPESFRSHWLGVHFFNPPRYMKLVELIPTPDTSSETLETIASFCEVNLGKTVVRAKDTPNFIGNRIGIFNLLNAVRLTLEQGLRIEDVDLMTGTLIGWPKSGTFRLADMIGLDVLDSIAKNFQQQAGAALDEMNDCGLPDVCQRMIANGWLGDKSKQGFYRKTKKNPGEGGSGNGNILEVVDLPQLEYVTLTQSKQEKSHSRSLGDRLRLLALEPGLSEIEIKEHKFLWRLLSDLWLYCAAHLHEIAGSVVDVDRAMKAGFNWELGPFEMWDAAGVAQTVARMKKEGRPIPESVEKLIGHSRSSNQPGWYGADAEDQSGCTFYDPQTDDFRTRTASASDLSIRTLQRLRGTVIETRDASLIDMGDGIGCIEFHSKMNSLSEISLQLVQDVLKTRNGSSGSFDGFVIVNDGAAFSVGANLAQLLEHIEGRDFLWIERYITLFQSMNSSIRHSPRPVIAAPFGLALGGGAEIVLHSTGVQAHAELHMGLVETNVGLIPAGGGCRMLLLNALSESSAASMTWDPESSLALKRYFDITATGQVSSSAIHARRLGLLPSSAGISMNRDRLAADAKLRAVHLTQEPYAPPALSRNIPAPGSGQLADLNSSTRSMREGGHISEHDEKVYRSLAHVLCGGEISAGSPINEQYVLDLEREAFLSLCAEPKTKERIDYTLKTGKPLKN